MELTKEQIKKLEEDFTMWVHCENDGDEWECHDCGTVPNNHRLWWESGGYEYPHDGTARCDKCAMKVIDDIENFDGEGYFQEEIITDEQLEAHAKSRVMTPKEIREFDGGVN